MSSKRFYAVFRTLTQRFIIEKKLGSGGFGIVYGGVRKHDQVPVAIKIIESYQLDPKNMDCPLEVSLMRQLGPIPGVIKLYEAFYVDYMLVLVMEWIPNSINLYEFVENEEFSPKLIQSFFHQLVETLMHCLYAGVVHHDLKPENILVDLETNTIKLIDFGCGSFHKDYYTSFRGTEEFLPPEYYRVKKYDGEASTVWSAGVLLFCIFYDQMPFEDVPKRLRNLETNENDIFFPEKDEVPPLCKELIQSMLIFNPDNRPSLKDLLFHSAITSPWVDSIMAEELNDISIIIISDYDEVEIEIDDNFDLMKWDDCNFHEVHEETAYESDSIFIDSDSSSYMCDFKGHAVENVEILALDCGV